MNAQHTPGPWSFDEDGDDHVKVDGARLATPCVAHPEWKANARLIAAAPELLAELKAALGYMMNAKIDLETGCPKATAIRTISGGIERARAAITKATSV